jgi:hypothetical protein
MDEGIELVDDVEMYRIPDVSAMNPFLMTVVSNSDLWMFVSSTGGLTAGRVNRDRCIFPYETDDRLHVASGRVGPATVLRVRTATATTIWEPFVGDGSGTRRSLLKSLLGDAVVFEEQHLDLGLTFRYRWAPSERFGWVRTASLTNHDVTEVTVDVVDGVLGVMPWGISAPFQQQMSNLANAYRRSEIVEPDLGIFTLEASIVDRPEPAEALRATTVWSTGLDGGSITLDPTAISRARHGEQFQPSTLRTGRPGSYLVDASIRLAPGQVRRWHLVADVAQGHADIVRLRTLLGSGDDLSRRLDEDIRRSSAGLRNTVATADGIQATASAKTDAHHLANTLFNVMRGGTFLDGYTISAERFRSFVHDRNAVVALRQTEWLAGLADSIQVDELRIAAAESGDADLVRLAHEYLPLAFSRRHGDPSRPWNHFAIRVRDDHGEPILSYQGNWRDIFQNWEALSRSFPAFLPSMIAKFLNASTADGFNPYRITSDGIDWEVIEPDNPWSGIGYWGDHQIVYLDRLLRAQHAYEPTWLASTLGVTASSFADVPYRIVSYDQLVRDPKSTLDYDVGAEAAVAKRVDAIGADGKLLADAAGDVVHVTLLEKLLIPALAKISNFVPRGGIWMNTQRPEWNDANNALVGFGLSMVTLAHLRRYLGLIDEIGADLTTGHQVSADVVTWIEAIATTLESHQGLVGASSLDDESRQRMVRELGEAYGDYRSRLYEHGPSAPATLSPDVLRRFTGATLRHLDDSIRAARRPDGLYDSYNLIRFSNDGRSAGVEQLPLMLEGQVAAISSGLLQVDEVTELVRALYDSDLYRPDVDSFVLYPAKSRPSFLERNRVPAESVEANPLLCALVEADVHEIVVRDVAGEYHFNADFQNVADLRAALDRLADTAMAPLVDVHRLDTLTLFERVFHHHEFTGRSSTMYGYEGIGSVYWHMVAKLLVAVQECILAAPAGADPTHLRELIDSYERIRGGLGFNKTAAEYGAFPTDPYSHTPAHAGAQQPGMTGQVKEELLTRWAELGLTVDDGAIHFTPVLLDDREFATRPSRLTAPGATNGPVDLAVAPGQLAFTFCQVPIVIHADGTEPAIRVTDADGAEHVRSGLALDRATSKQIFERSGAIVRVDVFVARGAA